MSAPITSPTAVKLMYLLVFLALVPVSINSVAVKGGEWYRRIVAMSVSLALTIIFPISPLLSMHLCKHTWCQLLNDW